MVGIGVDVDSFVVGFSVWIMVPSVRFSVTSRKLHIFRFALFEMFSPCYLNFRVILFFDHELM